MKNRYNEKTKETIYKRRYASEDSLDEYREYQREYQKEYLQDKKNLKKHKTLCKKNYDRIRSDPVLWRAKLDQILKWQKNKRVAQRKAKMESDLLQIILL